MPVRNEFLAMIYDNLAECYEEDRLYNVAIENYRAAYQILKGKDEQTYPMRGIARVFLLQNERIVHYIIINKLLIVHWQIKILV